MASLASHQRSVQFSENPVSAVRMISPPRTPDKVEADTNVLSTPSRDSTSSHLMGLGTVSKAKEYLLRELEGFVVPFESSTLCGLLSNAASTRKCQNFFKSSGNLVYGGQGWIDIPESPDAEKDLYLPLVAVINTVIHHFKLQRNRQAFDTHDKDMHSENIEGLKARPDIVITASGRHFHGELSRCDRWYQCLSTVEVKKELSKTNANAKKTSNDGEEETQEQCEKKGLAQLAFYARQTLSSQPTRMFVYNILITERRVRLYSFDRVGVQYSDWINYRDDPSKLVQMILLVAGPNLASLGIDKTVAFRGNEIEFTLRKDGEPFIVTANYKPRFSCLSLRGRATVCWSVHDNDGNVYLLKQQFVDTNRRLEHEILAAVQEKPGLDLSSIGTCVMGQIFATVSNARGMASAPDDFHDRWCYRMLLVEHGDSIDNLTDKTQLDVLVALRDAISAHKVLWDAGIIHRDISCNNILYQKKCDTDTSLRGVLIDFDLAIELLRKTSNCRADFRTGTRAFQSICILESYRTTAEHDNEKNAILLHEHLDDLESFFWVLFWITREQVGPGSDPTQKNSKLEVRTKFESAADDSALCKKGFLSARRVLAVQPGWGDHVRTLVRNLASFFNDEVDEKQFNLSENKIALTPRQLICEAPKHYSIVLGHFDTAISAIKQELDGASTQSPPKLLRDRVKSLPNTSILLPAPEIQVTRRSSKRFRVTEPTEPSAGDSDQAQVIQPPPLKRVRTAKSESALPRVKAAGSLRMKQDGKVKLDRIQKHTRADKDDEGVGNDAQASGTSRGRPSARKSITKETIPCGEAKSSTSRVSSRVKKRS